MVALLNHSKWRCIITSNRNHIFALILLAATAVFSTASISTVYFKTVQTSSLVCQQDSSTKGVLNYTQRGAVNESKNKNVLANCPVLLGPTEGSYQINSVVFANDDSKGGNIQCELIEVESLGGNIVRTYQSSVSVSGGSTALLTWHDIEPSVPESVFNLSCVLLPKTGLVNISVSEEI
jgi:hypothetical protein